MNWLLNRLLSYGNATDLLGIATGFHEITVEQKAIIARLNAENFELKLEYARWGRGVVENFLIALDSPEIEMRDILIDALADFKDEVARLEEHAPS